MGEVERAAADRQGDLLSIAAAVAVVTFAWMLTVAHHAETSAGGVASSAPGSAVLAHLDPPPDRAIEGRSPTREDGCLVEADESTEPECLYGDGQLEIALFGDSHAEHWMPALLAHQDRLRIRAALKGWCPPVENLRLKHPLGTGAFTECGEWVSLRVGDLLADPPDILVLGARSSSYAQEVGEDEWLNRLGETVADLSPTTKVVMLQEVPKSGGPDCLVNHGDVALCEPDLTANHELVEREREVVERNGGSYVDTSFLICPQGECHIIEGDRLVYWDPTHITAQFVTDHSQEILDAITSD